MNSSILVEGSWGSCCGWLFQGRWEDDSQDWVSSLRFPVRNWPGNWKLHDSRGKRIVSKKSCLVICPKYDV